MLESKHRAVVEHHDFNAPDDPLAVMKIARDPMSF
jgi:hypothetical protein